MSITKILGSILAVGVILLASQSSHAQDYHAQILQPLIDPGVFGHDLQFFAPAELGTFGGEPHPRVGWFGSYDRMYLWVSRPENEPTFNQGDFTWGNRWELGYMTDDDHGWQAGFMHVGGPNVFDTLRLDRINRINEDDDPPDAGDPLIADQNTIVAVGPTGFFSRRFYDVQDSLNDASFTSFELNKTFRKRQLHHGGILEPFMGVRYMQFTDRTRFDVYQRFDNTGELLYSSAGGPPVAPPPVVPGMPPLDFLPDTTAVIEQLTSNKALFENNMFGGQLGAKINVWRGRWNFSSEVRAFAMQNFQNLRNYTDTVVTLYDGGTQNSQVDQQLSTEDRVDSHFDEFVFGAEIRAAAAFEVTRDVALQFGFELVELGQGIGRGANPFENTQTVTMAGAVFGLYIRR